MSRKRQRDSNPGPTKAETQAPKRRRQISEQDQQLAKLYENLADEASDIRLKAAKALLIQLSPEQNPSSDLISKTLNRLIRGLCSGRKAARYGFFVALTELLQQFYGGGNITEGLPELQVLIELVIKLTQPEGKATGQERRDYLFGRLSAYKALIQSSVLTNSSKSLNVWKQLLELVCGLANEVPWLREECGLLLCDAVKSLDGEDQIPFIEPILKTMTSQKLVKTPEGVAVWLTIASKFNKFSEYPQNVWTENNPLHSSERSSLSKVMRQQTTEKQSEDKSGPSKSGSWQQALHFAWVVLFDKVVEISEDSQSEGLADVDVFKGIWVDLADNVLFSESSSYERKFWGFQLFSKMLGTAPAWALPQLFSPNLMGCLMSQRSDSKKLLFEAATEPLKKMRTRVRQNPGIAGIMVSALTSGHGTVLFDRATKTKTLEEIMSLADDAAYWEIVSRFDNLVHSPDAKDQQSAEKARQAVADLLLSGLRSKVKEQPKEPTVFPPWISDFLSVFLKYAYCTPRFTGESGTLAVPELSPDSVKVFQLRLSSCLSHLLSIRSKDPSKWPYFVVRKVHTMTKSSGTYQLAIQAEKPILKSLKRAYETTKNIAKDGKSKNQKAISHAFVLLFSLSLLQAYSGDAEAISLLEELETCYRTIQDDEGASGSFDQLIEILLSFLSKPGALFRKMAERVFATFSGEISEEGLQSLISILQQPESLSGQQELFDRDNSVEGEDGEDDEIDSDVEMVEETESDSEDEGDDASQAGEDDGEVDPEMTQFEHLLAETLKTSRPAGENGVEESSDGESMDDEQMMAIEPHLEKIFKQRKSESNKKKEKKDARETVINFKKRVLDLLMIYVKQESANPLTLQLILPLLQLVRTTKEASLAQRANEVLKLCYATCTKQKLYPVPEDIDGTWDLLKEIHAEAHRKGPKFHGGACSRASTFVVKALMEVDRSHWDKAEELYSQTKKDWFHKRRKVMQSTFFTEWISFSNEAAKWWEKK